LADVSLVGAGTVRGNRYDPARLQDAAGAQCALSPVPPIGVVTRSYQLDWGSPIFTDAEQGPVVMTVASAIECDRAQAARVADVIGRDESGVDFADALAALAERGYDSVLAEGGPRIAAQLATAGFDEVCITVAPVLAAGTMGRFLADGLALLSPTTLTLANVVKADGYLFLKYRRP
jgi:riboflavin biosynthesis pyrimidine reductase